MAEMNLLKGSYHGKLAETYGVEQNGKHIIKAVPFSHAPHNKTQKNSFTAFGCLQRISAQISKTFWNYLSLSDKKQQKINAVAHWLKNCISDHEFKLEKLALTIPQTAELEINAFDFQNEPRQFTITYQNTFPAPSGSEPQIFIGVFAENGKSWGALHTYGQSETVTIPTKYEEQEPVSAVAFLTYAHNKKRIATALAIKTLE